MLLSIQIYLCNPGAGGALSPLAYRAVRSERLSVKSIKEQAHTLISSPKNCCISLFKVRRKPHQISEFVFSLLEQTSFLTGFILGLVLLLCRDENFGNALKACDTGLASLFPISQSHFYFGPDYLSWPQVSWVHNSRNSYLILCGLNLPLLAFKE